MLVLKLKANDCVTIGDGTVLTVKQASEGNLRLAISAPEHDEITHARAGRQIEDLDQSEIPGK